MDGDDGASVVGLQAAGVDSCCAGKMLVTVDPSLKSFVLGVLRAAVAVAAAVAVVVPSINDESWCVMCVFGRLLRQVDDGDETLHPTGNWDDPSFSCDEEGCSNGLDVSLRATSDFKDELSGIRGVLAVVGVVTSSTAGTADVGFWLATVDCCCC